LYICVNSIAMKKIIILSFLLLIGFNLKAQTIIPIENYGNQSESTPNGTYYKDVNHLLDKYIGAWSGEYNGNTIIFIVTKSTENFDFVNRQIKMDFLSIHYKIIDTLGNILVDVTSFPADNIHVMHGIYFDEMGNYHLNYSGYDEIKCARMGDMAIKTINGDTQMEISLLIEEIDYGPHCTGLEDQIFSEEEITILDKQ